MTGRIGKQALSLLTAFAIFFLYSGVIENTTSDRGQNAPDRIILTLTEEPATSLAVTWRTVEAMSASTAQIAQGTDRFDSSIKIITVPAAESRYTTDNGKTTFHHSVLFTGLTPATQYLYRVGGDSVWSEWDYFTTAAAGTHDFSFLYFADAQHGLRTFYPRVIREAYKRNGGASFALFSGDLIDRPQYDSLWYEFFDAGDIVHRTLPSVMVPGNHEYGKKNSGGSKDERGSLTGAWRVHFRLPKNGVPGLEETSYSFVYQGVLFVMLNGNDQLSEQAAWLEKLLSKNRLAWTIVTVHQPLYSMSKERDQRKTRNAFLPVFDKYSVDLVLQGHDHVYARSKRLKNGIVSAEGTVYVTSDAGSDAYRLNLLYADLMEKYGTNVQLYQVIALHQRTLTFTAFMANGKVYDSFTLMKERK